MLDVFLESPCFFDDPADVGNLISGSSAFSKPSLNIWKFMVHVLLKSGLKNFEHYFTSVWDKCNCALVCSFFGIAFLIILSKVNKKKDKYHMISHQIANICCIIEKAREFKKKKTKLRLLHWLHKSLQLCWSQQPGKFFKRWESQTTWPASWEIYMQVRKQQLELDMDQQTGSK